MLVNCMRKSYRLTIMNNILNLHVKKEYFIVVNKIIFFIN